MRKTRHVALVLLFVSLAACADPTLGLSAGAGGEKEDACPVTIPPSQGFAAPEPWPSSYPQEGWVWYGTDELWTALALDGDHGQRKSAWWSVDFPGGKVEEKPDVSVTWRRIGEGEPQVISSEGPGTNAYTPEDGWFMIAGIDPVDGCWEVTATYKGASLSYVFES